MKKMFFAAATLALISLVAFTTSTELPIGSALPHPDLKMKEVQGKEVSFNDVKKEGGLLVMFSCNTCPYVIKNQQRTKEIASYAQAKNIGIILINSNEAQRGGEDSFEAMKAYAKDQGYQWPYVTDQGITMADAFGANRTPECFLFNKEGKLVYHGAIDDNPSDETAVGRHHLKEAVNEMLSGKEISVKTSRSVGCTIKRKS